MKKMEWFTLLFVLGLDAASKTLISTLIPYGTDVVIIKDFFWLTYLKNTGAAWSFMEGQQWFFITLAAIACVVMGVFFIKSDKKSTWLRYALIFMFVGAFGNLIDRLTVGGVRDFLAFNIFGYHFPVFNVADMALNVGVACMIIETILDERRKHA
jgi:signal peptidase II